ncbi:acyltransferase family protein [Methylocystis bryophila]|uniref:Acyltransferase n=1 Tax=Methylocystis bryophila TaxID=655015 RepID=A0A1W6MQM1_9HYPH|nr:acyltransferase [Methylocystis bryophila]ARN79893.1 acyltransferase [Methylocystis bryophila]BDV39783.1 LPS biosynthesis protein [Methylocystis bryophila]
MPFLLSQLIEAYRWIGALIVISVHATNTFLNLGDIMTAPHAPQVYAWWFVANFALGHEMVLGFFVLSGYLVGGAVLASMRKRKDFLREYFIHRFARIYIVTVPTLFLTLVLDGVGRNLPDARFYELPVFQGHWTEAIFLGNILNFQEILVPAFGTNSPLWSLACEFWYYICFPLLALPLAVNYSKPLRYGGFALGLAIFLYLAMASPWFRFGFLLWVIGALASLPARPLIASRWASLALYVAALVVFRFLVRGPVLEAHPWLQDIADLIATLLLSNLLLTTRHSPVEGWNWLRRPFHHAFANFSFSIYSIHMPILVLCRALVDSTLGPAYALQPATPANWVILFAVLAIVLVASYSFSRVTEAHTGTARRFLSASLPRFAFTAQKAQELQS